jgi:ABC-type ATPase with predicted acetyltransferase domain
MRRAAIHYPSDHDASIMRRCAECGKWYRALASDLCAGCRSVFGQRGHMEERDE